MGKTGKTQDPMRNHFAKNSTEPATKGPRARALLIVHRDDYDAQLRGEDNKSPAVRLL
jgi:hypothetical protein